VAYATSTTSAGLAPTGSQNRKKVPFG